jgi:DMSO/TMAO reductase YedYZ molybdopterin-dependent catalytic subunit
MSDDQRSPMREHDDLTRRYFLSLGAVGLAAATAAVAVADEPKGDKPSLAAPREIPPDEALSRAIARLRYLTPASNFTTVERGDPLPSELPEDQRRAVGLARETWQLEIVADPESDARLDNPLSKENGKALDWPALMRLAETKAVRYLKVMTCTNINSPLGMGLWEGVPLRDVIALAQPADNVRRVYYWGYHNDKPDQLFASSLSINRVLEEPPGELPVLVCYKLNGDWLSPKRGGPARIIVPEAYGFKSVKWLQRVVLTNDFRANDTYAKDNNDVDSPQKSFARFVRVPDRVKASQPIPITGLAQCGVGGLAKVQYAIDPAEPAWPADDPHFTNATWRDAELLPPPSEWPPLADGKLPEVPLQFDASTGKPRAWPLRYTLVHWAVLAPGVASGKYIVRCRSVDNSGNAQPLPRPFPRSGRNPIESRTLMVS